MANTPAHVIQLLDGGLGTTLKDNFNVECDGVLHPLWSSHLLISSPETLLNAQKQFVAAGAQILLTATYQASLDGFARTKTPTQYSENGVGDEEAKGLMRSAVKIARDAFEGEKGEVALSLGAYGAVMVPSQEYSGSYDARHASCETLASWHSDRLSIFSSSAETWQNIDVVAFETIPRMDEVKAIRKSMSNIGASSKDFWISCVFPNDDDCLPDGTTIDELTTSLLSRIGGLNWPYAIGLNCTKLHKVAKIVRQFENAIRRLQQDEIQVEWPTLVVYPDGTRGEVYNTTTCIWEKKEDSVNTRPWYEELHNIVSSVEGDWRSIIVGGCCKTGPVEISMLSARFAG